MIPSFLVLSIAGSDSGAGAGMQADLKTILALGGYGTCAVTALTAQNTCGVQEVFPVPGSFLSRQIQAVWEDLPPQAVKIGMLPGGESMEAVAEALRMHPETPAVLDPVMLSTSGTRLLPANAVRLLQENLFPLCRLITPNLPEAEVLWGAPISGEEKMEQAARELAERWNCSFLIKGGHLNSSGTCSSDFLWELSEGKGSWFREKREDASNSHGTGCTLSSAIACGLAQQKSLSESILAAKRYLTGALRDGLNLGRGNGPLNHAYSLKAVSCPKEWFE